MSSIATSGTVNSNYTQTNNCSSVAANASCTINVTFAPTAPGTQGATLSIVSNAPSSPDTITLTGTAE